MNATEEKVRELLKLQSLKNLFAQLKLTERVHDKNIPTVRGWLYDEIERRYPDEFLWWLDNTSCYDEELHEMILRNHPA